MIRTMTIEDYEQVHDLWMKIHGFGIRSVDDSKEVWNVSKEKSNNECGGS